MGDPNYQHQSIVHDLARGSVSEQCCGQENVLHLKMMKLTILDINPDGILEWQTGKCLFYIILSFTLSISHGSSPEKIDCLGAERERFTMLENALLY